MHAQQHLLKLPCPKWRPARSLLEVSLASDSSQQLILKAWSTSLYATGISQLAGSGLELSAITHVLSKAITTKHSPQLVNKWPIASDFSVQAHFCRVDEIALPCWAQWWHEMLRFAAGNYQSSAMQVFRKPYAGCSLYTFYTVPMQMCFPCVKHNENICLDDHPRHHVDGHRIVNTKWVLLLTAEWHHKLYITKETLYWWAVFSREMRFERNYLHDGLAAGIAGKGAHSVIIKDNIVERASGAGIGIGFDPYWWASWAICPSLVRCLKWPDEHNWRCTLV